MALPMCQKFSHLHVQPVLAVVDDRMVPLRHKVNGLSASISILLQE